MKLFKLRYLVSNLSESCVRSNFFLQIEYQNERKQVSWCHSRPIEWNVSQTYNSTLISLNKMIQLKWMLHLMPYTSNNHSIPRNSFSKAND